MVDRLKLVIDVDATVGHWVEREFIGEVAVARIPTVTIRNMMIAIDTVGATAGTETVIAIGAEHHRSPATPVTSEYLFTVPFQSNCIINSPLFSNSENINYRNQTPSNKIIVLGLAKHLTEADVSINWLQWQQLTDISYFATDKCWSSPVRHSAAIDSAHPKAQNR